MNDEDVFLPLLVGLSYNHLSDIVTKKVLHDQQGDCLASPAGFDVRLFILSAYKETA